MLTVPQAASLWHSAGVSTIPILTNGTKRAAIQWAEFQARLPELGEIDRWWGNGHDYGLAVICGKVSGNLEMTELEGRVALSADLMVSLDRAFAERNLTWLWEGLRQTYSEWTPSGGLHLIYRIKDHPVPGNEKIARRPATDEELAENPQDKFKVLAETRGEGGYVIVAPTSGLCHPSGESWMLLDKSQPGLVPEISWDERQLLHEVLRDTLDETPVSSAVAVVTPPAPRQTSTEEAGSRPGDEWAARTTWSEILESAGWTLDHQRGEEEFWVRPGKNRRDGHSATVNYQGSDLLKVFSSSVQELEPEATYTKFGAYAALFHGGDHGAAAKELARSGWGTPYIAPRQQGDIQPFIEEDNFTLDDVGNAQRMMTHQACNFPQFKVAEIHRRVEEEKKSRVWNGTAWVYNDSAMYWEADKVTRRMMRDPDEAVRKTGSKSRSKGAQDSMVKLFFAQPGMTVPASEFDPQTRYLNLRNGIYDLETGEVLDHHPKFMLTRKLNATYNPQASAPEWTEFLERALPDQEMRDYVQRCLGYTLLGTAAERAMFVIYGPSGTGKSTFLETLNHVFGDYGETAPAGTFRATRSQDESAATPALHRLKGKRFVTTSETSEGVQWNEELVKRYTGRDLMSSRGLYESFQTWRSEASIWMATNHAPRFTSDDRAIWNRVKLVPFTTVFLGEGQRVAMDDVLCREADGILNWLLEGLAAYRLHGLAEPGQVTDAVTELREQSDSVIRFLDDRVDDGTLVLEPTKVTSHQLLYQMYTEWCRQNGDRALGGRRFTQRVTDSDRIIRSEGRNWIGVGRAAHGWLGGTG